MMRWIACMYLSSPQWKKSLEEISVFYLWCHLRRVWYKGRNCNRELPYETQGLDNLKCSNSSALTAVYIYTHTHTQLFHLGFVYAHPSQKTTFGAVVLKLITCYSTCCIITAFLFTQLMFWQLTLKPTAKIVCWCELCHLWRWEAVKCKKC